MKRTLFNELYKHLDKKQYTILVGARQTGKTTLLRQLQQQADEDGKHTYYFNLEHRDVLALLNEAPQNLLRYMDADNQKQYVFIDEIQYLDDPSGFLKLIYDEYSDNIKIIATGSSAFYIDRKFNDSLAGRKRIFRLGTCSFEEYLELADRGELLDEVRRIKDNKDAKSVRLAQIRAELEDYIIYGGYPQVAAERNKDEKIYLLKELRDSYLHRDVYESGVVNSDNFYKLYTVLSAQTGSQVNVSELSKALRMTMDAVNNYLMILQKCFHIALIKPFYRNVKKELVKSPKVYIMDTGMRNCMINYFPEHLGLMDDGALFENAIFHMLSQKYDTEEIKYWRTADQEEVDFDIYALKTKAAYEVKYNEAAVKAKKKDNHRDCPFFDE